MNRMRAIRKELHGLIDNMPETTLYALRPLLNVLADNPDSDDLTDEELTLFLECRRDFKEKPGTFVSLSEYKKRRGLLCNSTNQG